MKCSYPDCPNSRWKSPWEPEIEVEHMEPGTPPHHCTRLHVPRRSLDFQFQTQPVTLGPPSPHHALTVMTAPRQQDTLSDTLRSLQQGGIEKWSGPRHLVADYRLELLQDLSRIPAFFNLSSSNAQQGSAKSFIRSLEIAIEVDPNLDYLTFLEDDISLCKSALDYVARVRVPGDLAFVTWFTYDYDYSAPKHPAVTPHPGLLGRPVLACRSSRYFILNQACTFSRKTIDKILRCPTARHWPKIHAHDELVSWVLGDALYGAHFPVIVQHVGSENSAVTHAGHHLPADAGNAQSGVRSSPYYLGDEFDAASLLKGSP